MLYFLLSWGLLLSTSFVTGIGILTLFPIDNFSRSGDRFFISAWLGLVVLANIFLAIALVIPLSPLIGLLVLGLITGLALRLSPVRTNAVNILLQVSDRWLLIGALIAMGTASLTSKQVSWFDTGLYHFGAIRWIADYGAVPGIALLNNGFAFVSSWFALAAPFNPGFLGDRSSAILNGYLFFLVLLQGSVAAHYILAKRAVKSDWFIVIYCTLTLPLFVFTPFLSAILISPSPDLPVILITGIVAWATFSLSQQQQNCHTQATAMLQTKCSNWCCTDAMIPLVLGLGAVTFKLNGLPIVAIAALYYIAHNWDKPTQLALGAGVSLILLSPLLLFGIVTSGCPLYPSSWMCAAAPWALSSQQAAHALARINGWQDWFGSPPSDANVWLWTLSQWLQISHLNKVMLILVIIAIPSTIWILKKTNIRQNAAELWIIALSLLGMGFIFSQAPLIRFGLGYFVLLPTLILATVCTHGNLSNSLVCQLVAPINQLPKALMFGALFIISLTVINFSGIQLSQQLVMPPQLPTVKVNLMQVNNIQYFLPENSNKCWGSPLPCAPQQLNSDVWLRNPETGLRGGFRRR
ncbi:hypothetical protein N836_02200 [Leptolyngbya sp. Heron Island J]|uniref:LIC_10190 family membrane protein n=1 Tax=Leptolyngbya sp. Heron Island J TaxID=1385935 RepID=UPI0003B97EE5|nr:hypothetical protein [Leptolyngbya sp. Heron Island J]ESA32847.1 hypothetical protein N836_02200 [Leptolyngbya sp. Heron Island J]